jgi:polyhydroxyalkanoate synthase subunit PhaC
MSRHESAPPINFARKSLQQFSETVESSIDPLGMTAPLLHAQLAWASHPQELAQAMAKAADSLWALQWHSWRRLLGLPSQDPVRPHGDDDRFTDPVWAESPSWDVVKEWYLVLTHHTQDMLYETPGLSQKERRRAAFWWRNWLNAMAPSNFLWTNPVAMRIAMETHGESLVRGFRNFLADMDAGNIRMTDPGDFKVGENLAMTPGKVVFRNRLLEVIHYTPTRPQVHGMPVVIVTPWINKFYILDLNPKKSMIRYLLDQGLDVFITSWKNPGAEMREVRFDDYLTEGIQALVDTAKGVTGAEKVHAVGYCIGGTALSAYMAWANKHFAAGDVPVAHWTLFTTLVDFHKPGDIEVFVDEGSIRFITQNMERKGYLDGAEMASSFRLLRSNSLIWHYVVHGWLYGETPPPFDVLYWNMDTTRMPYTMHAWYLRELYLHNKLTEKDALTLGGETIDLGAISQPVYAVSAEDDHIAPWRQTFRTMNYVAGPKRFVLSSSGHILGIVNPPVKPPKRKFWVGQAHRSDTADGWHGGAETHPGSWWEDWMAWLKPQCGELRDAGAVATDTYPALADAPGTYVLER